MRCKIKFCIANIRYCKLSAQSHQVIPFFIITAAAAL